MAYLSKRDNEAVGARVFNDHSHPPQFEGRTIQKAGTWTLDCTPCGHSMKYVHFPCEGLYHDKLAIQLLDDEGPPIWAE